MESQLAAMQRSQAELSSRVEELSNAQFILEDKVDTNRQYIAAVKKNQEMRIVQIQPAAPATRAEPEPVKPPPPPAAPVKEAAPIVLSNTQPAKKPAAQGAAPVKTAAVTPQPAKPAAAIAQPAVPMVGAITNPLAYYKQALGYYEEGRWEECISAFEYFAKELPDHDYADNSLYWAGECYYSQDLYDAAITAFGKLASRYPGGNKAPDALLKVALSYRKLGNERKAKETARKLLDDYPFSDAAGKTQSLLGYP